MNTILNKKIFSFVAILAFVFTFLPSTAHAGPPQVSVLDVKCVDENGTVELEMSWADEYVLTNTTTGDTITEDDLNIGRDETLTLRDLADGEYEIEVFGDGYSTTDTATFTIDCDVDKPELELKKECKAYDGKMIITAPNGLDSWELFNTDVDPNTAIESGTSVAAGDTITVSGLADENYRFEGTLGNNSETLTFKFDCDKDEPEVPVCPFTDSGENEWVFDNFTDDRLFGENYKNPNEETDPLSVNLPSGTYDIKIFTYDSYSNRVNATQPQEQSFLSLRDGSGEITKTGNTVDLEDKVMTATQVTNFNNVSVDRSVTKLIGVHAFYANNEANSHNFECVKLTKEPDEEKPDDLTGVCEVSPNRVETGENVTWSSSASGGDSPYTFSWDLENSSDDADTQNVTTSYSNEGTFDGTVTITDDNGDQVERTCSVRVKDDDGGGGGPPLPPGGNGGDDDDDNGDVLGDRDFSVQCVPEESSYLIGEVVDFSATVGGDLDDEDDADWDWSGDGLRSEDNENATAQYTTTGIKEMRVEAEYDGETESDTCYVQIRAAGGITLDQVPYTGPGDTAKAVGFVLTILLLGLMGGYTVIRRREEEGIPIGIPTNQG